MNTLYLLDRDGYEIATHQEITIAEGKKIAARLLADRAEYPDAAKVEIYDKDGECVWDKFRDGEV